MLKIENLNKSYKNNHIFNNFNLEIPKGKWWRYMVLAVLVNLHF